jgi:signal transduction histidine kinase
MDMVWAAVIALFTNGPNSPFLLFFFFVLLAAAYRWGSRATLLTAGVAVAILAAEAAVLVDRSPIDARQVIDGSFELNRFIMRAVYLLIAGYLLGYLGDSEKRARHEATAIASVLLKVRAEGGVRGALQAVLDEVAALFDARGVLLAIREINSGGGYLWSRQLGAACQVSEISEDRQQIYLFRFPGEAWRWTRPQGPSIAGQDIPLVLDEWGERVQAPIATLPSDLLAAHPCVAMLAVSCTLGNEWSGRLLLLDPTRRGENDLRLLQRMVREISPAIENLYLVRRIRSRAGAIERSRVARELHDGVIQSLIGLEMQVDVLRRQAVGEESHNAGGLAGIQALLRQEICAVRELMEQVRPVDIGPAELLAHLASIVDKFQRESGISARFVSDLTQVTLSPRTCREIARIVQEALVNVRRHSGARQALVRLGRERGRWTLVIDDDGRGFEFAGRLSQAELDAARKGPLVIKERVRSAGGELMIDSSPGRGSRLEIWLPDRSAHV